LRVAGYVHFQLVFSVECCLFCCIGTRYEFKQKALTLYCGELCFPGVSPEIVLSWLREGKSEPFQLDAVTSVAIFSILSLPDIKLKRSPITSNSLDYRTELIIRQFRNERNVPVIHHMNTVGYNIHFL
jgi:hypothetical protein